MTNKTSSPESTDTGTDLPHGEINYQHPVKEDGQHIWRLVKDSGVLDLNSVYCYLILCHHFSRTCMIAKANDSLIGFVSAYLLPESDDTLFVWQIAVAGEMRGKGIGKQLLKQLLDSEAGTGVKTIQCTVSPSNKASLSLFAALADTLKTNLKITEGFNSDLFPDGGHEQEDLLTIGPFK